MTVNYASTWEGIEIANNRFRRRCDLLPVAKQCSRPRSLHAVVQIKHFFRALSHVLQTSCHRSLGCELRDQRFGRAAILRLTDRPLAKPGRFRCANFSGPTNRSGGSQNIPQDLEVWHVPSCLAPLGSLREEIPGRVRAHRNRCRKARNMAEKMATVAQQNACPHQ